MPFFDSPTSFRLRQAYDALSPYLAQRRVTPSDGTDSQLPLLIANMANSSLPSIISTAGNAHSAHPDFLHLAGLVCEAVLEVIFVALPGYLVAWTGMFDANSQKFVAELNTMVFTPCLIFTKLASQLNADKLADLAVIPFIFAAQTIVSWLSAQAMARLFRFGSKDKKRQKNFIIAMAVFGNSNSLPISLVLSLSKTISGLHWDKIPGDNDDEVGARGILYLMIFQQLGQLLRWTWGYSVLLKPASAYEEDERSDGENEEAERVAEEGRYRDFPDEDEDHDVGTASSNDLLKPPKATDSAFGSGTQTPLSIRSSEPDDEEQPLLVDTGLNDADPNAQNGGPIKPVDSHNASPETARHGLEDRSRSTNHITTFPNFSTTSHKSGNGETIESWKSHIRERLLRLKASLLRAYQRVTSTISTFFANLFRRLPSPVQKTLATIHSYHMGFWAGVWRQMNPPLWAMLAALIVASIPALQDLFFTPGTLVNNSVSRAIQQSGGVAVPLILVVLGANLARSTLPQDQLASTPEEKKEERRLLWASLLSRMVLPTLLMSPFIAAVAKWVPVSILDDPIFIIVCFLLTGAPSALQLAQI